MAQEFLPLAVLPEDPSWEPRTPMSGDSQMSITQVCGHMQRSSGLHQQRHTRHIDSHRHIQINES